MKKAADILAENLEWVKETYAKLDKKLRVMAVRSRDVVADGVDENGRHINMYPEKISWWCNGFWGGLCAMMYEYTRAPEYLECAKSQESLLDTALREKAFVIHHDVGFMWHILSGALYRITGDKNSRTRNFYAANVLFSRFNLGGSFIRAWNQPEKADWTIVDTLMNLPLLYWASDETGDDRFKQIAMAQADTALRDHLRPDGSVAHIVVHDHKTGEMLETKGGQGYAVGSSWSRGCSWALYGFTLSYIHTKEQRYIDGAKRAANYFISACADDWLPRLDFRAPEEPLYYDSTAGMVAACGLIELSKLLGENEGGMYMNAAIKLLRAMTEKFVNFDDSTDLLVGYGSGAYPLNGDMIKNKVHTSIIYGDYYYAEALLKLLGSDFLPW